MIKAEVSAEHGDGDRAKDYPTPYLPNETRCVVEDLLARRLENAALVTTRTTG
ncbi:hypothetical protein ACFORH_10865 [Amycolatopsis roodepoortensis]|uniref:Uncharacterized protein n=1 Tax=Amycolatopsis roodepoortensis TaxID=700274 RepID=A0ABR9LAH1_9PSEU|nr:hypothetical protein [Amycolatopsis roodepoortensis]MBE1577681.1 hypothetical protein [Amycolatopsis roodepoortensis]